MTNQMDLQGSHESSACLKILILKHPTNQKKIN